MFQNWGFLLAEIWVLLALAALVGLFAGWLIWGGRDRDPSQLNELRALGGALKQDLPKSNPALAPKPQVPADVPLPAETPPAAKPVLEPVAKTAPAKVATPIPTKPKPQPVPEPIPEPLPDPEPEPVFTHAKTLQSQKARKPQGLPAPRNGVPDDLCQIKGVGAKMEALCNSLGFWHFDQIAAWTPDEIAWVDENLEGFKGRVTRDDWVQQAQQLSSAPAFVRRKD